jgi:hypothetical protein
LKNDKLKGVLYMSEKTFKTRIIHKHDTEANWILATGFTPKQGELIIYDPDATHPIPRMKIGDGATNVNALPFVSDVYIGPDDPGVNSGMIWIDTSNTTTTSAGGAGI